MGTCGGRGGVEGGGGGRESAEAQQSKSSIKMLFPRERISLTSASLSAGSFHKLAQTRRLLLVREFQANKSFTSITIIMNAFLLGQDKRTCRFSARYAYLWQTTNGQTRSYCTSKKKINLSVNVVGSPATEAPIS